MNNKTLLKRKRNKCFLKYEDGLSSKISSNSSIIEFNGFNIMELCNEESSEPIKILNNIIISGKPKMAQKNDISITKAKNVEEYYTLNNGISVVKENCFHCLMNNFLSNELLYFNSRKNLFNYVKYCFMNNNKIIFNNEEIFKDNKNNFLYIDNSFLKGWRFFIPKTICKGCFMEIINKEQLIFKIKNIFSDTDEDSLNKTNYKGYALYGRRFRAAFNLSKRRNYPRRTNIKIKKNRIKGTNLNKDINSENNENTKNKGKKKTYNIGVKYNKNRNLITIFKKNLDNSIISELKNNKSKNKKNQIFNLRNDANSSKTEATNNILKNTNLININSNIINDQVKQLLIDMYNNFNKFFESLDVVRNKIYLVDSYMILTIQKIYHFILYPSLLKVTQMLPYYKALYFSFNDDKKNYENCLLNAKNSSEKANNVLNNILKEINKDASMRKEEKNNLISIVEDLKSLVDENNKALEKYDLPFNNFMTNYKYLYNLINELLSS